MVQAVPEARAAGAAQATTGKGDSGAGSTGGFVGLDPGGSYSFRCDLTGSLGAGGARCVVTAIYYSYPGGAMPPGVWTGTAESAPVVVETKGAR
jgi:hypothetical protein